MANVIRGAKTRRRCLTGRATVESILTNARPSPGGVVLVANETSLADVGWASRAANVLPADSVHVTRQDRWGVVLDTDPRPRSSGVVGVAFQSARADVVGTIRAADVRSANPVQAAGHRGWRRRRRGASDTDARPSPGGVILLAVKPAPAQVSRSVWAADVIPTNAVHPAVVHLRFSWWRRWCLDTNARPRPGRVVLVAMKTALANVGRTLRAADMVTTNAVNP